MKKSNKEANDILRIFAPVIEDVVTKAYKTGYNKALNHVEKYGVLNIDKLRELTDEKDCMLVIDED